MEYSLINPQKEIILLQYNENNNSHNKCDLPYQPLLQWSWGNLWLKKLCLITLLCNVVHYVDKLLAFLLLQSSPHHRASLLYQFVQFLWVTGSDAAAPIDGCKANCTLQHRLIEDIVCNIWLQRLKNLRILWSFLLHCFQSSLSRWSPRYL